MLLLLFLSIIICFIVFCVIVVITTAINFTLRLIFYIIDSACSITIIIYLTVIITLINADTVYYIFTTWHTFRIIVFITNLIIATINNIVLQQM